MRKRRVNAHTPGRVAIDWLKVQYEAGRHFPDGHAILDALKTFQPARFKSATLNQASGWDRQARYELYEVDIFVTQPVRIQRYARDPQRSTHPASGYAAGEAPGNGQTCGESVACRRGRGGTGRFHPSGNPRGSRTQGCLDDPQEDSSELDDTGTHKGPSWMLGPFLRSFA